MIDTQVIANFLTQKLNEYSDINGYTYDFDITAEIDEDSDAYITGIVRSIPSEIKPIKGYTEVKYAYDFELLVPYAMSSGEYLDVLSVVNKVIENYNDTKQDFGTGYGIVTFSSAFPLDYKQNTHGSSIPMSVKMYVTYTDYGTITSSDKHWFFDGIEIPFLSESIAVQTEGITKKIATESYKKTLLTGQMRLYTFTVPHDSEIGKKFQELIFNYSLEKQYAVGQPGNFHKLKYYDGETFTEASPFETTVTLYQGAKSTSTRPNASTFEITFTDADDGEKYPKYFMGLIDFAFDNQSEDTRYFDSIAEQQQYFESKVAASAAFIQIVVPNLDSLDITNQIYPMGNYYTPFDVVNKNYAVIKYVSSAQASPQYFYYFVTNAKIGADGQVAFDLHLDTVQTYFFRPTTSFADCLIERAHLNRFQPVTAEDVSSGENVDDYVKFVTDPATKIYNAEDALNYPKRLVKRTKLGLRPTGIDDVDNWLNENVAYWVYVYLSPSTNLKHYNVINPFTDEEIIESGLFVSVNCGNYTYSAAGCYCYPIYKKGQTSQFSPIIKVRYTDSKNNETVEIPITVTGKNNFEILNNGTTSYYNIKLSNVCPFYDAENINFILGNRDLYIDLGNIKEEDIIRPLDAEKPDKGNAFYGFQINGEFNKLKMASFGKGVTLSGLFTTIVQSDYYITTKLFDLPYNSKILKSDIKDGVNRLSYNPKLNGQNFRELIISASDGETFTYDIQKLQKDKISFLYTEPLQPEVTKYYMRVNTPCGLYEEGTESNYMGLVGSTDTSIAYISEKYIEFIANNKNFWMQSNLKIETGVAKAGVNVISNLASGNVGAAVGSAVGAGIDTYAAIMDRSMTVDNMKNAPAQMKNANGNVIFNMQITDLGLYVEEFSALEADLKSAFDFMELYGFSVNAIDNIKNYVNIRTKHNYIKAQLQNIYGNMSNIARSDLRQRFIKGIRFWNQDEVDYNTENYEKWLNNTN